MQKVRSHLFIFARTAYKTTNSNRSLMILFTIAYVLYLAFEEGSPTTPPYDCLLSFLLVPLLRRGGVLASVP